MISASMKYLQFAATKSSIVCSGPVLVVFTALLQTPLLLSPSRLPQLHQQTEACALCFHGIWPTGTSSKSPERRVRSGCLFFSFPAGSIRAFPHFLSLSNSDLSWKTQHRKILISKRNIKVIIHFPKEIFA